MLPDIILFPIFLSLLYCLGRGVLRQEYPPYFYFIAAWLTIGFTAVIVNFFIGAYSPITYIILISATLFGATKIRKPHLAQLPKLLALSLLLSPLATYMPSGPDAGLYHLPHQLWIRSEKIVFGLANFHSRFGFGSFMEYVSAPLWIHDQFKLLSYSMAGYMAIFLMFLFHQSKSPSARTRTLALLTLLGLIINSKYLIIGFTSTDTPSGLVFALTFLYGLALLSEDGPVRTSHLNVLFLCALFSLMSKANGIIMLLWAAFVVASLVHAKRTSWTLSIRTAILPAILTAIWTLRGAITSGCLFYPLVATCLNVPWVATSAAVDNSNAITAWARHPGADLRPLHGEPWFFEWWLPNNWQFCAYELLTILLVAGFYRFYFREKVNSPSAIMLPALGFVLLCLGIWFVKSPTPRFGIGIFILLPAIVTMSICGLQRLSANQYTAERASLEKLLHLCRLGPSLQERFCRLIEPKAMLSTCGAVLIILFACKLVITETAVGRKKVYYGFTMLPVDTVDSHPNPNFGVRPLPEGYNDQCWLTPYCTPDDRPHDILREYHGYKLFRD